MRQYINSITYLVESDILVTKPHPEAYGNFYEKAEEVLEDMISAYKKSAEPRMPWKVVPAARLMRIWKSVTKDKIVRDEKGLRAIAEQFYANILTLCINTEIAEHGTRSKEDILDDYFDTSEEMEEFVDWAIETERGGWRISDHGLPRLIELACLIAETYESDDLFQLCDAVLNVTHQRSDLASWFVEGGTATMDALFAG